MILGVNLGYTYSGKKLHDGGAALICDGKILGAVGEERLSREKYAGGFTLANQALLDSFCIARNNIDLVVVSTCCEPERTGDLEIEFPKSRVITCNHHLSHAWGAFAFSGFEKAIVIVMDGGGNVLDQDTYVCNWWEMHREQQTYFVANASTLTMDVFQRDFSDPFEAGIGEIYRAFTYFLGWKGSRLAGHVMSLAAYGNPDRFPRRKLIWLDENGRMRSVVRYCPKDPVQMASSALKELGIIGVSSRHVSAPINQTHCDLAAWLQQEVETAIAQRAELLIQQTGISNICLAGGVAYNCRAVGSLTRLTSVRSVFVGPAAGDQGQCLGNAIYGSIRLGDRMKQSRLTPFLGPIRTEEARSIVYTASDLNPALAVTHLTVSEETVARKLVEGAIGAIFQGRSEFGPRALGNRSILAFPHNPSVTLKMNIAKGREAFMPFAPAVLIESAETYFDTKSELPYMTMAVPVTECCRKIAPAIVHLDETSRVQTVSLVDNPFFYRLLKKVGDITDHPVLLNTSFNASGEPIVETVKDALCTFDKMGLDFLWVDGCLVEKSSLGFGSTRTSIPVVIVGQDQFLDVKIDNLKQLITPFSGKLPLKIRSLFMLYSKYVELFFAGKKTTTIRYKNGAIDAPKRCVLPLYASEDFLPSASYTHKGIVSIRSFSVKHFGNLTEEDAQRDGFNNHRELVEALTTIYGVIDDDQPVSIYGIDLLNGGWG
jgi:carbamoyltransferase